MKTKILLTAFLLTGSAAWAGTLSLQSNLPGPHPRVMSLWFEDTNPLPGSCEAGTMMLSNGEIYLCQDDGFGGTIWVGPGSEWTLSGDYLYPKNTSSNSSLFIGIGTESPASKLHIDSQAGQEKAVVTFENDDGNYTSHITNKNPEGIVPARMGSLATDTTNAALYFKTSNNGSSDWVPVIEANGLGGACGPSAAFTAYDRRGTDAAGPVLKFGNFGGDMIIQTDGITDTAIAKYGVPQPCAGTITAFSIICSEDNGTSEASPNLSPAFIAGPCPITVTDADVVYTRTDCNIPFPSSRMISFHKTTTAGTGMGSCTATVNVKYK